ncbi:MAG: hypothetical protein ACO1SV_07955 [Fimbriimonas sp.]
MKRLLLAISIGLSLAGCGGSGSAPVMSTGRFAGTYAGPWVNVDDPSDHGTAELTFDANGAVTGEEFGPDGGPSGTLTGNIDAAGTLRAVLTEETEVSDFDGTLTLDGSGNLAGILIWKGPPVISYRYSLSRIRAK